MGYLEMPGKTKWPSLICSCRTLFDIYGATGLAVRGLYDWGQEMQQDPLCPVHGQSEQANMARVAWRNEMLRLISGQLTTATAWIETEAYRPYLGDLFGWRSRQSIR